MAKRDEDDLRTRLERLEIKQAIKEGVSHGVKIRCAAFWSGMVMVFGVLGSLANNNIVAVRAGFDAFWKAWGDK